MWAILLTGQKKWANGQVFKKKWAEKWLKKCPKWAKKTGKTAYFGAF